MKKQTDRDKIKVLSRRLRASKSEVSRSIADWAKATMRVKELANEVAALKLANISQKSAADAYLVHRDLAIKQEGQILALTNVIALLVDDKQTAK